MKEIPILYSTPMVQAKLAGRKTVTRRVIKPQPKYIQSSGRWYWEKALDKDGFPLVDASQYWWEYYGTSPYGTTGDILWARETFTVIDYWEEDKSVHVMFEDAKTTIFKLTDEEWMKFSKWQNKMERKPSLFLFKSMARIWEEVVSVRVERLHDITEEDAIKEGVIQDCDYGTTGYRNYLKPEETVSDICAKESYQTLWESINGPGSWQLNPFVWVITTKILSTTGRPAELKPNLV